MKRNPNDIRMEELNQKPAAQRGIEESPSSPTCSPTHASFSQTETPECHREAAHLISQQLTSLRHK